MDINRVKKLFKKEKTIDNREETQILKDVKEIAEELSIGEILTKDIITFNDIKQYFIKYPDLHKNYIKRKFPNGEYIESIDDLRNLGYDHTYYFSLPREEKEVLRDHNAIVITHDKNIVLGLFIPQTNIPLTVPFNRIIFISTSIYNYYYQKNIELQIGTSARKNIRFMDLLQYMESSKINDLHIQAVDEYQYEITARVGQNLVHLTETYILKEHIENLIHEALILMGKETLEEPPEITGLMKTKLIDDYGSPIDRTFRMNIVMQAKGIVRTKGVSIRRLMNMNEISQLGLTGLNYSKEAIDLINKIKLKHHGTTVIAGATNSGKSTLLAAILNSMYQEKYRIISIENPVEITMPYSQIDLSLTETAEDKFKMTREKAMNAVLRQDPDVVLISEVRSKKEVSDFIELGLRGHAAFTTFHAGDVKTSLLRLFSSTEEPLDVISSLNGIIAQELISKKCQVCHGTGYVNNEKCLKCSGTGSDGVIPIYEIAYFKQLEGTDDVFNIPKLIKHDKVEYISKKSVVQKYYDKGWIFDEDYQRIMETEVDYSDSFKEIDREVDFDCHHSEGQLEIIEDNKNRSE